jgi:hypothetical protein
MNMRAWRRCGERVTGKIAIRHRQEVFVVVAFDLDDAEYEISYLKREILG